MIAKLLNFFVTLVPWTLRTRIKSWPGIAQLQRLLVGRYLSGKQFAHKVDAGPAKGIQFWIHMPEDKGIWTGAYENLFAGELAKAVQPGNVALDIGGWHGFFSGVMAANGAAQVRTFEPLPENIKRIEKLISLNPGFDIQLFPLALSDHDGTAEFVVMPETSMAKLAASDFQSEANSADRIVVRTATLDSLVASGQVPRPDLIKIDVEGAEMLVLRGAGQCIASVRPIMYLEVHSPTLLEELRRWASELGYEVHILETNSAIASDNEVFQVRAEPR